MDEHLHNIDKLFKSAVNDYEEAPPSGVWDGIDKQLDKSNIVSIQKKYAYLKRAVVAVVLLFSVATLFALLTWHPGRQPLHASNRNANEKVKRHQQTQKGAARSDEKINGLPGLPEDDATTALKSKAPERVDSTTLLQSGNAPSSIVAVPQPRSAKPGSSAKQAISTAPDTNVKKGMAKTPAEQIALSPFASGGNNGAAGLTANSRSGKNAGVAKRSLIPSTLPSPVLPVNPIQTTRSLSVPAAMPGIAFMPATNSHSQTVALTTPRHHLFSATIFVSPGIAINRLEADRPRNREDDKDAIRNGEHNNVSFMTGITADLDLGHNVSLQSGLAFYNTVKTIAPKNIYARPDNHGNIQYRYNCSSGYYLIPAKTGSRPDNGDSIGVSGATNTLQYVSIPLAIKYKFGEGRFSFQPVAGVAANILTKEKIETPVITWGNADPQLNNSINGLKPVYFSGLLSVEAEWQLYKRFALRVAPTGRFALTSMNKEAAVKTYPAYFGLAAGITIKL